MPNGINTVARSMNIKVGTVVQDFMRLSGSKKFTPKEACYKSQRHEQCGDGCQGLHDFVHGLLITVRDGRNATLPLLHTMGIVVGDDVVPAREDIRLINFRAPLFAVFHYIHEV
jgi:hypothetical protein